MIPLEIVVAVDGRMGIGKDGELPWRLSGDMRRLKELTMATTSPVMRNAAVMGRRTWESIPDRFRPLRERLNVVLTRQIGYAVPDGVVVADDFDAALSRLDESTIETAFVLGGAAVYRSALALPRCLRIHLTRVEGDFGCDTFFDDPSPAFALRSTSGVHEEDGVSYRFELLERSSGEPS